MTRVPGRSCLYLVPETAPDQICIFPDQLAATVNPTLWGD